MVGHLRELDSYITTFGAYECVAARTAIGHVKLLGSLLGILNEARRHSLTERARPCKLLVVGVCEVRVDGLCLLLRFAWRPRHQAELFLGSPSRSASPACRGPPWSRTWTLLPTLCFLVSKRLALGAAHHLLRPPT